MAQAQPAHAAQSGRSSASGRTGRNTRHPAHCFGQMNLPYDSRFAVARRRGAAAHSSVEFPPAPVASHPALATVLGEYRANSHVSNGSPDAIGHFPSRRYPRFCQHSRQLLAQKIVRSYCSSLLAVIILQEWFYLRDKLTRLKEKAGREPGFVFAAALFF